MAGRGGGGDAPQLLQLILDGLQLLDDGGESAVPGLAVQFLWRYLLLAGLQPELDRCGRCGVTIPAAQPVVLSGQDGAPRCARCSRPGGIPLAAKDRTYLQKCDGLSLQEAMATPGESLHGVRQTLYRLTELALETRLRSLTAGAGGL